MARKKEREREKKVWNEEEEELKQRIAELGRINEKSEREYRKNNIIRVRYKRSKMGNRKYGKRGGGICKEKFKNRSESEKGI